MNRLLAAGFVLLLLLSACTSGQARIYPGTYPGDTDDIHFIHQIQDVPLTLALYGGKLEPYEGAHWYLSSGFETLLTVLIELEEPEAGERWLESLSIDVDVAIPGSSFHFFNSPGSRWELANKDRNITWAILQGQAELDANIKSDKTDIILTGEVTYGERAQGLFQRVKTRTVHIDEEVTVPIRPCQ